LKANGHPEAQLYPLGKLANEELLLSRVKKREAALRVAIDQTVGSAVFNGSKKAVRALNKLIESLEDG